MSQNTNNTQENIDQNSPKSFEVMANALGISLPEFVELERQKFYDICFHPEYIEANRLYFDTLYKVLRCLEEAAIDFTACIDIIKRHGYGETLFAVKAIRKQMQIFENQLKEPD